MNKFSHKLSLTYIANTMAIMTTIIYRSWGTCARTPRPRQLRNFEIAWVAGTKKGRGRRGGGGVKSEREMGKGVRFPLLSFSLFPNLFQSLPCG